MVQILIYTAPYHDSGRATKYTRHVLWGNLRLMVRQPYISLSVVVASSRGLRKLRLSRSFNHLHAYIVLYFANFCLLVEKTLNFWPLQTAIYPTTLETFTFVDIV